MAKTQPDVPAPPHLGLWDTVSIIVGIIIGVGIFSAPGRVFRSVTGPGEVMAVWALGGALSMIGALCFAELASAYPRSGGEYIYLTRAYGSGIGFLFAWAQLAVIRTGGGIAAVAYVFGDNAALLWPVGAGGATLYAILAIAVLSLINILGASPGKFTQNILTVAKVLGIGVVVLAGFCAPLPSPSPAYVIRDHSFALAMIFVLYTYDGWNEATYVSGEVRDWRRNVPRALILGTLIVTVIYLLYNSAILVGLGFDGAQSSAAPHADLAALLLGPVGRRAILVLVMISALGAVNGTIYTAARLYAAFGADHRLFAPMGWWNHRLGTPATALVIQAMISIGMIAGVGTVWRRHDGFEVLVDCTAPVFWLFFFMTGLSLFVLRRSEPLRERPFRVPLFPVLPLIFCGWCAYMLYGSLRYAREQGVVGLAILLVGLPLYALSRRLERPMVPVDSAQGCDSLVSSEIGTASAENPPERRFL
jgi:amino acid transporter